MSYVIGKQRIAYPPVLHPQMGGPPFITGAPVIKVASVLTVNTGGPWVGQGTAVPSYAWYLASSASPGVGVLAYVSATNASFSVSANNSGAQITCRVGFGNATWGSGVYDVVAPTTVVP